MNNPVSLKPGYELYPLPEGCTGNRLFNMLKDNTCAEIRMRDYLNAFERRNLVVASTYHKGIAKIRAAEITHELFGSRRTVVLLGRDVQLAFGIPPLVVEPQLIGGIVFRQVPHPSGRNLYYNNPQNVRMVGEMLAMLYNESIRS